jgi:hypothetical protein
MEAESPVNLSPMAWPLAGKIAGSAALVLAVGGASFGIVGASEHPASATRPAFAKKPASSFSPSTPPIPSQPASELSAACQVASEGNAVSQQNYDSGSLDYVVAVLNSTGQPVTLTGYTVTFSAYGQVIDTETPTINPALAEPGDRWNYTGQYQNAPQVTENTYLDESCSVTSIDTTDGQVTPQSSSGPNGNTNTNQQNIASAQQKLSDDVGKLSTDAQTLDSDKSLAGDLQSMKNDYGTEQKEFQTEQSDGCANGASGDASAVGGDASAVGGDMSALQGDEESLKNEVSSVNGDLTAVQKDLSTIQGYGASPQTSTSSAVAAGNKTLSDTASAISYATGQGNQYVSEANSLAQTAADWASNRGCPI